MNELNQLRVVQDPSCWDIINSISMAITAGFTIALFFIAFTQLRSIIKNNSIKTILDLESELYQRKSRIDEIASKIRTEGLNRQKELIDIYSDDLEAANENYFNILDRLCYCILKGFVEDRDWKTEYSDLVKDTVRSNQNSFDIGTYYKNVKKLYEKWDN